MADNDIKYVRGISADLLPIYKHIVADLVKLYNCGTDPKECEFCIDRLPHVFDCPLPTIRAAITQAEHD